MKMKLKNSKLKWCINLLLLVVILAIIFYVIRTSMSSIFAQLAKTSLWLLILVGISGVIFQFFEGFGMHLMINQPEEKFSTLTGFFGSTYIAFMRVITFGAGTLIAEVVYYRKKKISTSDAVGYLSLRVIFGKYALIILTIIGLIFFGRNLYAESPGWFFLVILSIVLTFLLAAGLLAISLSTKLQAFTVRVAHRFLKAKKWRDKFDELNDKIYAIRAVVTRLLVNKQLSWQIIGLHVVKFFFWLVIPYLVLSPEYPGLGFWESFFYTAFASIFAGTIPTPAGIGSMELAFTFLFTPLVGRVDAISALLLYRFANYVLPFLIGMIYTAIDKRQSIKNGDPLLEKISLDD